MKRTDPGDFCWIDLLATDLEGQTAFYEQLLGWEHRDLPTDVGPIYRMLTLDGSIAAGASQMNPDLQAGGMPSMWSTYIATDDVDATVARATALGGQVIMPAMDVMTEGRMVGIQDPSGGAVFFWQPRSHNGAEVFSTPGSLSWVELNTRDPQEAIAFFTALLPTWTVNEMSHPGPRYWQIDANGVGQGGIMPMPDQLPAAIPPHWLVYFGTRDVRATVQRARELGASVAMDVTEVPDMLAFAVLMDPAGATFAVLQPIGPMSWDANA